MALTRSQLALFDTGRPHDAETPMEHARRLNRERARRFRRRHAFVSPIYDDAPSWTPTPTASPVLSVLESEFTSTTTAGRAC